MTPYQQQNLNSLLKAKSGNKAALYQSMCMGLNRDIFAEYIIEAVAKCGEGFVVDICNRAMESICKGYDARLSEKQTWCIVYAFIKLTDEQVSKWFEEMISEVVE